MVKCVTAFWGDYRRTGMSTRKYINSVISNINFLKSKYENAKEDIIRIAGQTEYDRTIKHYHNVIEKLSTDMFALPIGYRYIGKFYIKKSYTIPVVFQEHYGSVYMREDLVSWQIESGVEPKDYSYHRTIFKSPKEGSEFELKRTDADPVYAADTKKILSEA